MTEEITLKEALELVEFRQNSNGSWRVYCVHGSVLGNVGGSVQGNVECNVYGNVGGYVGGYIHGNVERSVLGDVLGDVGGSVSGSVCGTINGREWQFIETPKEKLKRLIEAGADKDQLLEALNQIEDNS